MAAFFRRQILGAGSANAHRDTQQLLQPSTQPYILLVDRAASRLLKDNSTRTFEEITRVLREEGGLTNLEAVRMEDIPEEGQFEKVMRASILIGVHGAALTNMVWQPPVDSTVIEIGFQPRKPDYPNMARVVGRAYRYLAAEGVEEKIDLNPIAWKRVYVDSRKLLAVVQDVLVERTERKEWLCC
ncbi:Glycosyltransferase AER61, uncharacterized [Nannochloropsis gaditana]|uniref:Glycosyltransferase AER61, uncharacterized n=1 Tax=Nannochloropsis gaditana TaxID=72520 RepID=W7UCD4_9STRA|nr:Glycosyltransferase AER61, uncharacterized [Nannochloropsis gaditana]